MANLSSIDSLKLGMLDLIQAGNGEQDMLKLDSTSAFQLPSGTTAERPIVLVDGLLRFNTTTNRVEAYYSGIWNNL